MEFFGKDIDNGKDIMSVNKNETASFKNSSNFSKKFGRIMYMLYNIPEVNNIKLLTLKF